MCLCSTGRIGPNRRDWEGQKQVKHLGSSTSLNIHSDAKASLASTHSQVSRSVTLTDFHSVEDCANANSYLVVPLVVVWWSLGQPRSKKKLIHRSLRTQLVHCPSFASLCLVLMIIFSKLVVCWTEREHILEKKENNGGRGVGSLNQIKNKSLWVSILFVYVISHLQGRQSLEPATRCLKMDAS